MNTIENSVAMQLSAFIAQQAIKIGQLESQNLQLNNKLKDLQRDEKIKEKLGGEAIDSTKSDTKH